MTVDSRGTSNTNDRGSAEARRQRKRWLFETWAADVDLATLTELNELGQAFREDLLPLWDIGLPSPPRSVRQPWAAWELPRGLGRPAVRCFRCGILLDWDSVEIDRIKAGCEGGRYTKGNIRPVCGHRGNDCNAKLSGEYVRKRNTKRKARNATQRRRRQAARAETYEGHA